MRQGVDHHFNCSWTLVWSELWIKSISTDCSWATVPLNYQKWTRVTRQEFKLYSASSYHKDDSYSLRILILITVTIEMDKYICMSWHSHIYTYIYMLIYSHSIIHKHMTKSSNSIVPGKHKQNSERKLNLSWIIALYVCDTNQLRYEWFFFLHENIARQRLGKERRNSWLNR